MLILIKFSAASEGIFPGEMAIFPLSVKDGAQVFDKVMEKKVWSGPLAPAPPEKMGGR